MAISIQLIFSSIEPRISLRPFFRSNPCIHWLESIPAPMMGALSCLIFRVEKTAPKLSIWRAARADGD
jgi:hypothetical protein